jgi:formate dehydrogenase iron-sulfur subunit
MKMWRRSWLSREVLLFTCFSAIAGVYAALLWYEPSLSAALGAMTFAFGAAGVTASACIYLVRARPAWNTNHTIADFFLTAALLGSLLAATADAGARRGLLLAAAFAAAGQLLNQAGRFLRMTASDVFERKASAQMLSTALSSKVLARGGLLLLGSIVLPLLFPSMWGALGALALSLAGEILGRYLFFVSVVPKAMAATYLSGAKAAA